MPVFKWSEAVVEKLAEAFVSEYHKDRELALTGPTLTAIARKVVPGWQSSFDTRTNATAAKIIRRIEQITMHRYSSVPLHNGKVGNTLKPTRPSTAPIMAEQGTRIYWTESEEIRVADQVVELFILSPDQGISVPMVNTAIQVLPEERRRKIITKLNAPGVWQRATVRIQQILKRGLKPKEEVKTEPEVVPTVELPPVVEKPALRVPTVDEILRDVPIPRLAAVLAEKEAMLRVQFWTHPPFILNSAQENQAQPQTPIAQESDPLGGFSLDVRATLAKHELKNVEGVKSLVPNFILVGVRGHQVAEIRKACSKLPVHIASIYDPARVINEKEIEGCKSPERHIMVDTVQATDTQRHVIRTRFEGKFEALHGYQRILDKMKATGARFKQDHPDLANVYEMHCQDPIL